MKTIIIKNEKGGTGKSTMATHIAAGLAQKGRRVLLIDGDVQAHSCYLLGVKKAGGLYNLLVQEQEWKQVLVEPQYEHWGETGKRSEAGRLLVLPGDHQTANIANSINKIKLLRERLSEVESYFDAVVIDTSPTPSLLHTVLDLASDYMICPVVCALLPIEGLYMSALHLFNHNENRVGAYGMNAQLQMIGIIPMMYENTLVHREGRAMIVRETDANVVWDPIAKRTIWGEREFHKKTLFAYAPLHAVTAEVWRLVDRVAQYV